MESTASTDMPAVRVCGLVKNYGQVKAARGVTFDVRPGEIFGLLGPNGAGKTTTLECVIGLRPPDGGTIEVGGVDAIAHARQVRQRLGAQLQSTALQDKITPREALRLFAAFYPRAADVESRIDRFSLREKADASFDSLSGGQKQRLALALAFVNDPEVVFLDEPTTGLDPQSRRDLHQLILQMRAGGHTVVLTTHYIEEAHVLCDRIAIIDGGRVIASGTPDELVAASSTPPRIIVRAAGPLDAAMLSGLAAVEQARICDGGAWELSTVDISQTIMDLVLLLQSRNNELLDLHVQKPTLEDVFIEMTGASLRE